MNRYIEDAIERMKESKAEREKAAALQLALWNGEKPERQPLLLSCQLDEEDDKKFPGFNTKESHYDSEKMFLSGFRSMMSVVYAGAGAVPSMRANMGCGIFPTLFGIRQELYDDKMPWVKQHLSKEVLAKMGPEDLKIGDEFKAGLEHMAYMAEKLKDTGCLVFPMDLQGSFDTAHLVYGDDIFFDIYDDPDFLHHLLNLCCEAIYMGMEECFKVIPGSKDVVAHYNCLVMPRAKGGVKLSEDTSTLLSKDQIDEFVSPYMNKILEYFGGGYIHYCGKNPHLFDAVMNSPLSFGLNFGNPEKHDMVEILKECAKRGKIFYGSMPREKDEGLEEHFVRYLEAAKVGDRSLLLMTQGCRKQDRDQVLQAWENANNQVFKK